MREAQNAGSMLTIEETAQHLSLTPETVRRLIRRGELRATKLGKVWRVSREVLRRLEAGEAGQAPDMAASAHDRSAIETPLKRALAMVKARDARTPLRAPHGTSAAEEIEAMRDERLVELSHGR